MKRVFAAITLAAASSYSLAYSFKVKDIQLEGLQRVSASPVFAALPFVAGEVIDSGDVREVIQSMLATGFFQDVQVARDGDILIVILSERPAVKTLEIEGNKLLKSEQLLEVMKDNGLAEGEIFQPQVLEGIGHSIENQYISQARYDASLTYEVIELLNNQVEIKIEIDEGSAASIVHYNIVGNKKIKEKDLKDNFELDVSKWYRPFSKANKYAKERLTGDIEKLESHYLDRGYLDFEVLSSQVSISPDKESVYITLNVQEGDIYNVTKVDLAGDPILSEERIRRLFLLRPGDIFSQAAMTRTSEFITTILGNSGYTNAKVEGITSKDQETKEVEVTFFIDPGKRTYVRRINFNGNTKTTDQVLRREMRQLEGAPASNALIEQSKVRLERLGFFKEVGVETLDVPGSSDLVDVVYTVEEQPSGSVSASVGYADASGFNLGFSVSESNWLGTGNSVSIGATRNVFQENYTLSFNDPYFTPDGVSRGISFFHRVTDFDEVNFSGSSSINSTGVDVTFGYPVSEVSFLRFGVGYNFQSITTGLTAAQQILFSPFLREGSELSYITQSDYENFVLNPPRTEGGALEEYQLETFRITDDVIGLPDDLGFLDENGSEFYNTIFNVSWSRRTLNRGILATRGNSQTVRFEAAAPSSDLEYFKLTYEGQLFQPLTRDLTLRFRTRLGIGDGYSNLDELPFFENFRAGGFGSVRGFERFTLGPKVIPAELFILSGTGFEDIDNDGTVDPGEIINNGSAYVLCEDPTSLATGLNGEQLNGCIPGTLISNQRGLTRSSSSSFGGNILMEFSTELLLPIPFIKDTRTMQLVAFVDAGNVFSDSCRPDQFSCFEPDINRLSSSYGIGFKWLSALGPLTFSFARPIKENELDRTKFFDFTFGTGF